MAFTVEQVLSLAPDAASATAGRGLASPSKWEGAGRNDRAAWGEAKGSGSKPYQTVVALGDGASKCSCPSRKFPCKHALGLLLRVAADEVPGDEPPAWAGEWLERRSGRAAPKAEAPTRQADPKSAERRWATVLRGLEECEAFLHDAVGNGLLSMGATRSWDEMAARMVDAQAPGVARRLRRVGETIGVGSDWGERAAADLGSLGLLLQAARRIDALGDLGHDVRAAIGIPSRREDAVEAVVDVWDAMGTAFDGDERVVTYRTWLRGRGTRRWAKHLAFAAGGVVPARPLPGRALADEARFFPSAWPVRAHFETFGGEAFHPSPGGNWAGALDFYASALAENPWTDPFPVHLSGATLGLREGLPLAIDAEGQALPVRLSDASRWGLLARTGNRPTEFFGEFDGHALRLLFAWGEWGTFET